MTLYIMVYGKGKKDMKKSANKTIIKIIVAVIVATACYFGVRKIVMNYTAQNGTSVGGSPKAESTSTTETTVNVSESKRQENLDKLETLGAEEFIKQYAQENGIAAEEYPDFIIEMLDKNPAAIDFALNYPTEKGKKHTVDMSEYENTDGVPLFIQWDKRWGYIKYGNSVAGISACGPVSLSMVAYYLTKDENMSPNKIIKFAKDNGYCVPGNGTSWTLISEGAKKLGLKVKELSLNENLVKKSLQEGKPVICIMGPGDFTTVGHYIVLTGYEDGYVTVNDSNSVERSNKKWKFADIQDQIRNLWSISK